LEPVPLGNTLGAIDGLEFGSNGGFESQAYVDSGDFVPPPMPGDVNGDLVVDINDFNVIQMNYGMTGASRMQGDLTNDTNVDLFDFKQWKSNRTAGAGSVEFANVPEPASLVLLVCSAVGLLFAARRRSC
ncbi:MAG: PEP-CTERM sorting domain-containing protein, partial [Aeoliella sp.]